MGCSWPSRCSLVKVGRPLSSSATHSRANVPSWISPRIFFISALVAALTTRGPRVRSPYSAVSEIENRSFAMPPSYMRSTISLSSCRHSKYAISGA